MSYEKNYEKISVVDVTLRDGGLVNDFYFEDTFVKNLYEMNIKAGIDIMEFGYKASKNQFNENEFGKWKFCNEEDIRSIVGDDKKLKVSVMADVGRTDYETDIIDAKDSVIDIIRVATYSHQIEDALTMIEYCKNKGYYVTCNIMAISNDTDEVIQNMLDKLTESKVDAIFIVDSYGALYPSRVKELTNMYLSTNEKRKIDIGIHVHNNQQLAFANTITAKEAGATLLDVSICGMGRGAGNCMTEQLIPYLKSDKYKLEPVLQFIDTNMKGIKRNWGYDIPYLITGVYNKHPRTAISVMKQDDYSAVEFLEKHR